MLNLIKELGPEVTNRQLAEELGVTVRAVQQQLEKLESHGYVSRTYSETGVRQLIVL